MQDDSESDLSKFNVHYEYTGTSIVRDAVNREYGRRQTQIKSLLMRSGPVVSMMLRRARQRGSKTKESVSHG